MMETVAPFEREEMKTLTECIELITKRGYKTNFMAIGNNKIKGEREKPYASHEIKINTFYRFEGDSDPGDSSILYAIETNDGEKGYLTNAYGPYADTKVSLFIDEIESIQKQTENRKPSFWRKLKNLFS
ncbi:MAG TPA: hypothetical protein VNX01_15425 [Bacteroidia bacterium]|nr:hypothetical protein [Bacteroidia bacterium]